MPDERTKTGEKTPVTVQGTATGPKNGMGKTAGDASGGSTAAGGGGETSFLDKIYSKITEVIGGDNPNQYFCLTLPGTILEPEDYTYDIKGEKPAHVKANESKLVNKLFDACFITASDNGRHLPNQYKTALSMLSPKLNRDLFEMKVRLREVLMTPYRYDFGDGSPDDKTLEQVFYRLYGEYVEAKAAWNQKQAEKRAELKRTIIDPVERQDAYLEWYGLVAEAEQVLLEEKLGSVLNVFSPSDMNIINAILNCGVGGEIEAARSTLDMVEELNPDGGYVYPVSLYPSNWFKLLDSSFTGVDLLESPAALSQRMRNLEMQRSNIVLNISKLTSVIPDKQEVNNLAAAKQEAEKAFQDLVDECVNNNIAATADMAKAIVSLCKKKDGSENVEMPDKTEVARVAGTDKNGSGTNVDKLIEILAKHGSKCYNSQSKAVAAAGAATQAALEWCEAKNKQQLRALLEPLNAQLDSINSEIEELKDKLAISRAVLTKDDSADKGEGDVMPNKATDGFTQVLIQSKMSAVKSQSSKQSESSQSSWGVSFFLGGYSGNKSHQKSVESAMDESSDMEIQIGMNIAKVQIGREWFDPGVFLLTDNMYNFSADKISPPDEETSFADDNLEAVKTRFDKMNQCIFPSYPVAFVIAKDVSIRFTSRSSVSSSFAESIEDHASQGGGFLIFSGNSSSASSSSQSAAMANSNANSVTVRFTAPQILGYYMQATPADKSTHINSTGDNEMSIIGFVSKFKEMIEDYNKNIREGRKKAEAM